MSAWQKASDELSMNTAILISMQCFQAGHAANELMNGVYARMNSCLDLIVVTRCVVTGRNEDRCHRVRPSQDPGSRSPSTYTPQNIT